MLVKNLLSKNEINYKNFENTRFTPFNEKILKTFEKISKRILSDKKLIEKKDIFTFGFWCRRKNLEILKKRFCKSDKIFGAGFTASSFRRALFIAIVLSWLPIWGSR